MNIRQATSDDVDALIAFNQGIARETEDRELDHATLKQGITRFLSRDQYGFYTVAEIDNEVVGSLMITYEWSDWRNGVIWWIQSVYVTPTHRRKGVYTALYQNVRRLADVVGDVCAFRLYVEKDNQIAQQTYRKMGMAESCYLIFED